MLQVTKLGILGIILKVRFLNAFLFLEHNRLPCGTKWRMDLDEHFTVSGRDQPKGAWPAQGLLLSNQSCYSALSTRICHHSCQLNYNKATLLLYDYFLFTQSFFSLRVDAEGAREGKNQGEANANSLGRTLWKSGKFQRFLFRVSFTLLHQGGSTEELGHRIWGKVKQANLSWNHWG